MTDEPTSNVSAADPAERLQLAPIDTDQAGVRASGEIDVFTAPSLARALEAPGDPSTGRFVVDLADVTFIDSTGLRVLIDTDRRLRERDEVLVLKSPSRAVARLLELTSLGEWLTVEGG